MKRWRSFAVLALVAGVQRADDQGPRRDGVGDPAATGGDGDGRARSCVDLNRIREARVVDDRTIDFYLGSREVLRNTLPNACPQLGFEKAFNLFDLAQPAVLGRHHHRHRPGRRSAPGGQLRPRAVRTIYANPEIARWARPQSRC